MIIQKLLVVALLAGMNASLCTGGLISVTAAAAEYLSHESAEHEWPMSYASTGYLTCKMNGKKNDEVGSFSRNGCSNPKACISRTVGSLHDRILPIVTGFIPIIVQPFYSLYSLETIRHTDTMLARAGPLYEQSAVAHHILTKKE